MEIYEDYTYEDVLYNEPCLVKECGYIYPVSIRQLKKLNLYSMYLILGKDHLKVDDEKLILPAIISVGFNYYIEQGLFEKDDTKNIIAKVISDLEDLFSIISKEKVSIKDIEKLRFSNDTNTFIISPNNFDKVRQVILKQNLLYEPKIYENEITQKWAEKVKKARRRKSKPISMESMINALRSDLKISYKEISEMNILQFNFDYARMIHVQNYNKATFYGILSSDVPNINFVEDLLEEIIKNPDDDIFKDSSSIKLNKALG